MEVICVLTVTRPSAPDLDKGVIRLRHPCSVMSAVCSYGPLRHPLGLSWVLPTLFLRAYRHRVEKIILDLVHSQAPDLVRNQAPDISRAAPCSTP